MSQRSNVTETVQVLNAMGLHTRPATAIVKLLQHYKSDVHFTYKGETVNAKSILSLLMLAVKPRGKIKITVDGQDAEETLQALVTAFTNKFGES